MAIGNISELESSLKLEEGSLQKAIENEESVSVAIPEGLVIRTAEEEDIFLTNKQTEYKTEFHTAGREIAIKEKARELGLELPKGKTMDSFTEALTAKTLADAKVEPNKKIEELGRDNDLLRGNLSNLQTEFDEAKSGFKIESQKREVDSQLASSIKGDFTLPSEDLLTLYKAKYTSVLNDNNVIETSKAGELLKDKTTASPISHADVMKEFLTPYTKKPTGGAAGGNEPGGGAKGSMEAFQKEMTDKGIGIGSEGFVREMQKRIENKTLKV